MPGTACKREAGGFQIDAIGRIRTDFATKADAPIQGAFNGGAIGIVELFSEYAEGLRDIEGFSHLILLYHLDRAAPVEMVRVPLLGDEPRGIFSTRHPARPNALGLTVVRLLSRDGTCLRVAGVDMLDGTPLIDVKPYVPRFDAFPHATEGWFEGCDDRPKPAGRE